jgi:hypothetical protein
MWEEWPLIIKRDCKLVDLLTNGWKCDFSHSNPIKSEVQPFFKVMNFQPTRVSSRIYPEFRFLPLKIRYRGRVTPKALTHSKQVIHSCRPGCFFSQRWFSWSSRTTDFLLDLIKKPVSSMLYIALGGYLCSRKSSPKLLKYDFIVEKSSAVDCAMSIVCEKHVLIRRWRVWKRSTHLSEIGLNSFSLFFELCSDWISEAKILTNWRVTRVPNFAAQ